MADLPTITVVTPSYNQGQFLEKTIRSVLGQGYPNLEYMVLDGGSKDNSRQIIEKYAGRLAFWRSGPDDGQAAAIAEGFQRATGEILCWLNSDDLFLPGALSFVGKLFKKRAEKLQWLIGATVYVDEQDRIILHRKPLATRFKSVLTWGCTFSQASSFWRKTLYEQVGGLDTKLQFCFDRDLFLKFTRLHGPGCTLRELSAFRLHPESKTSTLEAVRQKEIQMIKERWNVNVPWYERQLYWWQRVIWGKLTTRTPRQAEVLPPPEWNGD